MTTAFYARLARMNIKNNRKIYLPYILTCIGMVTMFYIVAFLASDQEVAKIRGGSFLQMILGFGVWVIAVFAIIFLFYTNSFLMKRRKKELGLFNTLGMGKRHIARVIAWETGFVAVISLFTGLGAGILLSKLSQLIMMRLLNKPASFHFTVSGYAIVLTLALFAGVFFLILLNSLRQVHAASPIELLRGGSVGEREPKANYLLSLLGLILLGGGYYLALTVTEPITAMVMFFIAVILVILGTYLMFISGSVALLKMLRRNKRYYYRTNHFVSVSGMFYRMKRNGAGLASICILSTMVLVMISSTTCMYIGADDALRKRYPRNIIVQSRSQTPEIPAAVEPGVTKCLEETGINAENIVAYRFFSSSMYLKGNVLSPDDSVEGFMINGGQFCRLYVILAEDYEKSQGQKLNLKKGEVAVYSRDVTIGKNLIIGNTQYRVGEKLEQFSEENLGTASSLSSIFLFVPSLDEMQSLYRLQKEFFGENAALYSFLYGFDVTLNQDAQVALISAIRTALKDKAPGLSVEGAAESWDDFISLYGGLLFLGLLLGLTFILAAVMIMYYKQVTEGYEDNERFDIMKKVGMTEREVRKIINSQVLTVFALPLAAATVHMAFAFPMVSNLLRVFSLTNVTLFALVTGATIILFAVFYVAAYLATSRAYLSIVGGMNNNRFVAHAD